MFGAWEVRLRVEDERKANEHRRRIYRQLDKK
jgi:hypothetical protein